MTRRNPLNARRTDLFLIAGATLAVGALLLTGGCKKEPPPPPPVTEAPPPPPPPPQPTIADLMRQYDIDPRITLVEDEKPMDDSDPERTTKKIVAVLQFFDAMVRGADSKLQPMLASADQKVLADLVQQGLFAPAAKAVTRVVLGCGPIQSATGVEEAVFALVQTGTRFDAQLWTFQLDEQGAASFNSVPTPPEVLMHLSGTKAAPRIRQWADLLKAKMVEAQKPDELVELPSVDWSETTEDSGEAGGGSPATTPGSRPQGPGSPTGEPGRRPVIPGGLPAPRAPGLN